MRWAFLNLLTPPISTGESWFLLYRSKTSPMKNNRKWKRSKNLPGYKGSWQVWYFKLADIGRMYCTYTYQQQWWHHISFEKGAGVIDRVDISLKDSKTHCKTMKTEYYIFSDRERVGLPPLTCGLLPLFPLWHHYWSRGGLVPKAKTSPHLRCYF